MIEKRAARQVAWVTSGAHGLIHSQMLLIGTLVPVVATRFDVPELSVHTVGNLHYLAFGFGSIPAGLWADRFGSRNVLFACLGAGAVSAIMVALAPTFTLFSIGLVGLGAAASLYHPAGLSMLSRSTDAGALGRAIGIHGVGGNLGESLAPAGAALLAALLDWRLPFVIIAAFSLLFIVAVARLPDDGPQAKSVKAIPRPPLRSLLSGPLLLLLVAALASGWVYRGTTHFLPLHVSLHIDASQTSWLQNTFGGLSKVLRTGTGLGAIITTLALMTGIFAQWWGGRLADRFRRERMFLVMAIVIAPLVLVIGLTHNASLFFATIGFGFLWYVSQPLVNSLAAGLVDKRLHGTLYGAVFTIAFGLGSFAVSAGAHLSATFGTQAAFVLFAAIAALNIPLSIALIVWKSRSQRGPG